MVDSKLIERIEGGECSNALDVLIEVALFKPRDSGLDRSRRSLTPRKDDQ